jgi:hypothetical protein
MFSFQNEDKDRTIRQLQRQLAEAQRNASSSAASANGTGIAVDAKNTNNAATQTERVGKRQLIAQ